MDPYGDFARYVGGLDWPGAALAALVAIVVAGLAIAGGMAITGWGGRRLWELPPSVARSVGRLARLGRAATEPPPTRWLCGTCLSWNPPGSEQCSSGCGPRVEHERPVPAPTDELGAQRGGRGSRRR